MKCVIMNTRVSIIRCSNYSNVKNAIKESLNLIGGLEQIVSPGDCVLLKPNVLAIRLPEDAVTTHPAVVSAMCELVSEVGGVPIIGDGSGIVKPGSTTTSQAFKVSGMEDVASRYGVELINFHPNTNTATLGISYEDFEKFLKWRKNKFCYVDINCKVVF